MPDAMSDEQLSDLLKDVMEGGTIAASRIVFEFDRLRTQLSAAEAVCELQSKLLACFRMRKNPGTIIDRLWDAKVKWEALRGGGGDDRR